MGKRQYSNRLTISGSQTVKVSERLFGEQPTHTASVSGYEHYMSSDFDEKSGYDHNNALTSDQKSDLDQDFVYVMSSQLALLAEVYLPIN